MFKYLLIPAGLFFLSFTAFAQSMSGQILDDAGTPAGFASVRLIRFPDSTVVGGVSADSLGRFTFQSLQPGSYRVKAALLGFEDALSPEIELHSAQSLNMQPIRLRVANQLKSVTIRAQKPLIENRVDRVVVNVDGSALAAGNSAFELLQRAPGVVITPQESILLNGKGNTVVMIDGRPVQMNPTELAAFLKATPGESIQRIELIANPSSRYEAAGAGGIIDIRLKKNQNRGVNGSLSLGNTQSVHHRFRTGANLNIRQDKLNVFGNYNYVNGAQSIDQSIKRLAGGKSYSQSNPKTEAWTSHQFKTGADWSPDDRHTIGVFVLGNLYDNLANATNTTLIRQAGANPVDSSLTSASRNPESNRRLNYNINYRFADTLGTEWTIDADRIDFRMRGNNALANNRFDALVKLTGQDGIRSDLRTDVGLWSLKTDWTKTDKHGWKTEAGAKVNWTATMNDIAGAQQFGAGDFTPAPGRTNQADFRERITAAYANIGHQAGKWDWQAGLRMEHTDLTGTSTDIAGNTIPIRNQHYTDFFPTAFSQYKINDNNQIGAYYGRRINRPAYQDLNPFIWQTDPYTSDRGNPNLTPAYTHSLELKYTYRNAASLALGYAHTDNLVSTIARQMGDQTYTQPENLARQDQISLNANLPTPIASWWEGYLWVGVWHNRYHANLPEGQLDRTGFGGGAWTGQQIKLPRGFQLEVSSWAQFPTIDGMVRNKGIWSANLGLKKSLFDDKLSLKIALNDVFKSQKWEETVDFGSVHASRINHWESQSVAVSLNWNFGNSSRHTREWKSGAENENGRIRGGKND